ncbi:hypothetical protein CLCAR_4226 [Clostridium carboxidivorans P7]|nr:hypothetical protein CLCAR_4226 [Clostridium carboxidivorans P7]
MCTEADIYILCLPRLLINIYNIGIIVKIKNIGLTNPKNNEIHMEIVNKI